MQYGITTDGKVLAMTHYTVREGMMIPSDHMPDWQGMADSCGLPPNVDPSDASKHAESLYSKACELMADGWRREANETMMLAYSATGTFGIGSANMAYRILGIL